MKKIAHSLRHHRELIFNYFRAHKLISSGVVDGLNSKAKVTIENPTGFRTYLGLAQQEYNPIPPDRPHACGKCRGQHERVRARRCRQRDLRLQLPVLSERLEDAARVDGGLLAGVAAEPAHAAVGDVVRRSRRRGRAPAGRAQRRDRPGGRGREAHHDASGRRHGHVHRLDAGRARDHGAGGVDGEEGAPRARRQVGRDLPARGRRERVAHVPRRVHGAPGARVRAHDADSRSARSQSRDHGTGGGVRAPAPDRRSE